jgi:hypothetical protein
MSSLDQKPRTLLITGVNGYINSAVACAFVCASCIAYGLVLKESTPASPAAEESLLSTGLQAIGPFSNYSPKPIAFDAIVSTTEDFSDILDIIMRSIK